MEKEVIHVSEADAIGDFKGLLARVKGGTEAVIERDGRVVAIVTPAPTPPGRLLSESVGLADKNSCPATLDGAFSGDLDQVLKSHSEPLTPPSSSTNCSRT